jgi:hypothetical protein
MSEIKIDNFITRGFVENIVNSNIISGWAYIKDENGKQVEDLRIKVYSKTRQILAEGKRSLRRFDLDSITINNYFGFSIRLDEVFQLEDYEELSVAVEISDTQIQFPLPLTQGLKNKAKKNRFNKKILALLNDKEFDLDDFEKETLEHLLKYDATVNQPKPSIEEPTITAIPIGSISTRKIAISGRNGHFFLYAGSNNLDILYSRRESKNYLKWISVIKQRNLKAIKLKINYVQLIIPEKQSLIPELYPFPLITPTENLELLERSILENNIPNVISLFNTYEKVANKCDIFRTTDTHFSVYGAKFTVLKLLEHFDLGMDLETTQSGKKLISGDLGNKFIGPSFSEIFPIFTTAVNPKLIESFDPENGGHIGIRRKWFNDQAQHKLKVMVFGNSFFERGGSATGLSWWFARIFAEFYFFWSAECDWELVEKEKPDILICQTIERFLSQIPKN